MRDLTYPMLSLAACTNQETLTRQARISPAEATQTAEAAVPGARAKEAHLEREKGRTVYEVEVMNRNNNTRRVSVDAETDRIVKTDQ